MSNLRTWPAMMRARLLGLDLSADIRAVSCVLACHADEFGNPEFRIEIAELMRDCGMPRPVLLQALDALSAAGVIVQGAAAVADSTMIRILPPVGGFRMRKDDGSPNRAVFVPAERPPAARSAAAGMPAAATTGAAQVPVVVHPEVGTRGEPAVT